MKGYIKLHRKILDNPVVCKDNDYFAVWVYLLLKASHDEIRVENCGSTKVLRRGQLITGCQAIAGCLNMSESKVKRILERFKSERMIEQVTYPRKGRIITILNWNRYQGGDRNERMADDSRTDNERISDELCTDNERISDGNNNEKNGKNEKNVKKQHRGGLKKTIDEYTDCRALREALSDFVDMRKDIKKPLSGRALRMVLKKLDDLGNADDATKTDIVNQSVLHCWHDVYELKSERKTEEKGFGVYQDTVDHDALEQLMRAKYD